ncbi:slit homolog 3 protein-like [Agrilus planipennis]|uniref:Slit homolog 3 protein-like n=1 Tax=Agrilus planipennis TaxID=224129 RepID=A0A1W4WBW4_AGRPL|nr:slit homolog 3 protein-like [Agrilus planipennis]
MYFRICLVLVTIFLRLCVFCDKVSFKNVPVKATNVAKGRLEIGPVTGSLDPSNGLADANEITVRDQKIPILYKGAVKDLPRLYDLELIYSEIQEIEPGAFENVPRLLELKLNGNKISKIQGGILNNLNIKRLDLSFNEINAIEPNAFNDLPNLRVLLLDNNLIREWNPNWFENTPNLLMIHFSKNLLETLPAHAFKNVKGTENVKDGWLPLENYFDFSENKIQTIDPKAFEDIKQLDILDLRRNLISELQPGVFSNLEKVNSIWLLDNKITCVSDEFLDSLPHGHGIARRAYKFDANPWNCTCLEKVQTWSKEKGSKMATLQSSIKCVIEKVKDIK